MLEIVWLEETLENSHCKALLSQQVRRFYKVKSQSFKNLSKMSKGLKKFPQLFDNKNKKPKMILNLLESWNILGQISSKFSKITW